MPFVVYRRQVTIHQVRRLQAWPNMPAVAAVGIGGTRTARRLAPSRQEVRRAGVQTLLPLALRLLWLLHLRVVSKLRTVVPLFFWGHRAVCYGLLKRSEAYAEHDRYKRKRC
jgi:hypothetical protein